MWGVGIGWVLRSIGIAWFLVLCVGIFCSGLGLRVFLLGVRVGFLGLCILVPSLLVWCFGEIGFKVNAVSEGEEMSECG